MKTSNLGKISESLVANLLQKENFIILEQNYKKFFGEIDIIAKKDNVITFVEVKARNNPRVSMFELISLAKQKKIILVAKEYIAKQQLTHITYRFDVALVEYKNNTQQVSYITNAFYEGRM